MARMTLDRFLKGSSYPSERFPESAREFGEALLAVTHANIRLANATRAVERLPDEDRRAIYEEYDVDTSETAFSALAALGQNCGRLSVSSKLPISIRTLNEIACCSREHIDLIENSRQFGPLMTADEARNVIATISSDKNKNKG